MKNYLAVFLYGIFVVMGSMLGLWEHLETSLYDKWFEVRGVEDPGQQIAIILIDERSITRLGSLPWSRSVHAELLGKLKQAKAVGMDIVFDRPTDKKSDQDLAKAIRNHGRVAVAAMFTFENDNDGPIQIFKAPIDDIAESSAGMGFINVVADKGNVVRRISAADFNTMDRPIPSFSLAVTAVALGIDPGDLRMGNSQLEAGDLKIPVDAAYQTLIDFWGPGHTFSTYSYIDVLDGKIRPETFKDSIVLIGEFSPTERGTESDYYDNPFSKGNLVISGQISPGVEIHASAINTYITKRYFHRASFPINMAVLIVVWILIVITTRNRPPWIGLIYACALAAGLEALGYVLWLKFHYWLNAVGPMLMVGLVYMGATIENIVRAEMERSRTREMFSRYVSPAVVDEIMQSSEAVNLGGTKRTLTILFADIRGFTAYSENKNPEYIIARLNEYLTEATNVVFKYGGTLDKYLGDGLMAFFGAPIPYDDHADRAIRTAIEIQHKVTELNAKWQAAGEVPLRVAVGINSGPAVVGNVGSPEHMDYTVIGEDVNLASRVEALSKRFEMLIVISERSYNQVVDSQLKDSLYYIGSEMVKGFTDPIACYSISGQDLCFEDSKDTGYK